MLAAVVNPALAPVAAATGQALALKYQREFEQEADYMGVRYLRDTEYDPRATLDFFKKLEDESRLTPQFFPPYLRSHPMTDERLNHLEAVLKTKQWEDTSGPGRVCGCNGCRPWRALARTSGRRCSSSIRTPERPTPGVPRPTICSESSRSRVNRLEPAREALQRALDAGFVPAERELGRVALRQRKPEEATALLRKHLDRDSNDGMAWVELARAREAVEDEAGAREAYGMAVEAAPELDVAHEGYGLLAGRDGDQGVGFFHLGIAARIRGQYPRALDSLRRALPLLEGKDLRMQTLREIDNLEKFLQVEAEDTEEEEP